MRKITSFLALFLLFAGTAVAQISSLSELVYNTKAYSVETVAGKNYRDTQTGYDRSGWYSKFGSTKLISYRTANIAYNPSEASQQFIFEKDGSDNVYIYAVGAGMYLNKDNSYSTTPQDAVTIVANTAYAGAFTFYFDSSHYINSNGSGTISIDTWSVHDDGNGVYLTEQQDASAAIAEAFTNAKTVANANFSALNTKMSSVFTSADVITAQAVVNSATDIQYLYTTSVGVEKYVTFENKNSAGVFLSANRQNVTQTSDYLSSIFNLSFNADGTFYLKGYISSAYASDVAVSTSVTTTMTPDVKYVAYSPASGYVSLRPIKYADTGWSDGYHFLHFSGSSVVGWEASNNSTQFTVAEVSFSDVKTAVLSAVENFSTMIPSVYTAANVTAAKAAVNATTDMASLISVDLGIDKYVTMLNKSVTGNYLHIGETAASRSTDANNSIIRLVPNIDGTFYMQGYTSGAYLGDVLESTAVTTTTVAQIPFVGLMVGDYLCVRPTKYSDSGRNFVHFGGSGVVGWSSGADATQFTIAEVPMPVTINYVVKQGGVEIWRTNGAVFSGDVLTEFPTDLLRDYTTLSYPDAPYTVTNATGQEFVANITAFNPPFTLSTDYNTATWYIWHQHTSYSGSSVYTNGDNIVWATSGSTYEKPRQFAFMGDPYNGIKVISKAQGATKFLNNTDPATMTTTEYGWQLREQTNSTYQNGHTGTFGLYNTANSKYLNGQSGTLKYYAYFDQGSTIWVEEVPAGDFYVTYVIKDANDATLFTSDPVETYYHASINSLPSDAYYNMSAFYDYNDPAATIENNNTTVEFTATPKATPLLQYTTDTTAPIYYNLNIRSKYLVYNSSATGEVTLQTDSEPFNADASWAFVGTPYGGFQLYNKTKGTADVLTYTSVVVPRHSDNNIQFQTLADATGKYWYVNTNSNGFVLRMKENPNIYFHHDSSKNYLRTCSLTEWWNVHEDAGSTIVAATDEAVLDALYDYMKDMTYGDGASQYTATGYTAAQAQGVITDAGTVVNNQQSASYPATYTALTDLAAVSTLNMPAAGFYRIKGKTSDKYIAAGLASNDKFNMSSATDGTTIFYYNGSKLVNFSDGMVNGMTSGAWAWVTGMDNGSTMTFYDGNTAGGYGLYSASAYFYDNGDADVPSTDRGGSADMTTGNVRYRSWILEPVSALPVTVSSVGYATFYTPIAVEIPTGVVAYQARTKEGGSIVLTSIDDGVIPADFGVVLKATAGEYSLPLTETTWTASDYHSNELLGTVAAIDVEADQIYTLRKTTTDGVGFFLKSAGTLKGFRAYLPVTSSNPVRSFIFEDNTTGIQQVSVEGLEGKAYDLQGRRVQKPANGLYIVNGKKIIVK